MDTKADLILATVIGLFGAILGLIAWPFEPKMVNVYGAEIPRSTIAILIPAVGLISSYVVDFCFYCCNLSTTDVSGRVIVFHSNTDVWSGEGLSIGGSIVLPAAISFVLHITVLVAGVLRHRLGTTSIAFVCGLFYIGLGGVFSNIAPNNNKFTSKSYIISGIALFPLAVILPDGFWGFIIIIGLFLHPTFASIVHFFRWRRMEAHSYSHSYSPLIQG